MSVEPALFLLLAVVFVGYGVQTVAGFGAALLCMTAGAHFFEIPELVALLVPISLVQNSYVAIRHRQGIEWSLLLRRVLPLMGLGLVGGFLVARAVEGDWLRIAFGTMVLLLATRELYWLHRASRDPVSLTRTNPRGATFLAMLGAGVVHGIYATGGPLLVYAIGREGLDKYRFRSTVTTVWLVLNSILGSAFLFEGRYDASTALDLLVLLPGVPLGIVVGEWLHRKVDERRFKITVFALLVGAALALLFR